MKTGPIRAILLATAAVTISASTFLRTQSLVAQDVSRSISGGGVFALGWTGQIDPSEARRGSTLENSKLTLDGSTLRVTTGPASNYWNPKNVASGNYTVKATFNEPKFMNLNDHPHPYGLFIAGNDMGTSNSTFLYCAAYGNGEFIVRGFGPAPFQMNGYGASAPSVNKATSAGSPVTQEIAMSVTAETVSCSINGSVVAKYPKSDLVAPGKLKSTDGVYGIRFAHNTEGTVTGLAVSK
jgi:hypothetical protein